jgi:hypothetical protein
MPEFDIDYDAINEMAVTLTNAQNTINPMISNLQSQASSLLQPDGGLYLSQTSPAIAAQYASFNSAATQCTEAIGSFASLFNGLVQSLQSMDGTMAYSVAHPSGS